MPRVMALDVGSRTIGIAFSDEAGLLAFPAPALRRQEGYRPDMNALRRQVEENDVSEVVVGLPVMMDGSRGVQAEKVDEFVEKLRRYVTVPVVLQDERLSTVEADRVLIAADRSRAQRKQAVDSMAAGIILQTYLDRKRSGGVAEAGE